MHRIRRNQSARRTMLRNLWELLEIMHRSGLDINPDEATSLLDQLATLFQSSDFPKTIEVGKALEEIVRELTFGEGGGR